MAQVVLNLVTNALDASAEVPANRRRLVISSERKRNEIHLSVADAGPGIDPGLIERIFDPLFSTKAAGMGIGLAICKSIIEAHGGTLEVVSAIEKGSRFTIRLPAQILPRRTGDLEAGVF